MAITVISTPQDIQPVYNPIYSKVSSNETSQEGFNFLFDLYVNGTFVNRDKLLPRPGTTQAIYSPARILESYISYDLTQNITSETTSQNSIDKYKIVYGEEYIVYWNYTGLVQDTVTMTSYTIVSSTPGNPHGYSIGDDIVITQDAGYTYAKYNGVHKVVDVLDDNNILINVNWTDPASILYEPGRSTWADKRKTVFITDLIILADGTNYSLLADWGFYGPDGCAVEAGIFVDDSLTLIVPDVSCGTATQTIYYGGSAPITPSRTYRILYDIVANDPSGNGFSVSLFLGGSPVVRNTAGSFVDIMTCGVGAHPLRFTLDLSLADTAGFGSHSLKIKNLSIIEVIHEFEAYDINAVIQYEQVPVFTFNDYIPSTSTSKFLTKQPNNVKCSLTDRGSIGILNNITYDPSVQYVLYVLGTSLDGSARIPVPFPLTITGQPTSTDELVVTVPAYPYNLNLLSQSVYSIDVIDITSGTYSLVIYTADPSDPSNIYSQVTEVKTFDVNQDCSKYEPVRFMFLNSLGQFDYYTATLLSRTTLNTTRDTFVKTLQMGYTQGDRGKTIINVNSQESYSVNTNWVSESTATWLSYELFNSSEVYILDNTDGSITPIIIDNQSIEAKKRVNDSLLNYTFNYSKAVPLNTQRN